MKHLPDQAMVMRKARQAAAAGDRLFRYHAINCQPPSTGQVERRRSQLARRVLVRRVI